MSTQAPIDEPKAPAEAPRRPQTTFFEAILNRVHGIYFILGLVLVAVGSIDKHTQVQALTGIGLCVAGGLCFVASAIAQRQG